jgi:hypothetical protein
LISITVIDFEIQEADLPCQKGEIFQNSAHMKTTILPLRNSMNRSALRCGSLLSALALSFAVFALLPMAQAVTPAPDGGYPGANTAEGTAALFSLTTGINNTANGYGVLYNNTTGGDNTANGVNALYSNINGSDNTATGFQALFSNTTGINNTAGGYRALYFNTTGNYNTANGTFALYRNTGSNNTANGFQALFSNTTGINNTANGFNALYHNTSGYHNVANGLNTLLTNTTGHDNTAAGYQALNHNSASNNIGLGSNAGSSLTTGSGNVCIGSGVLGVAAESNTTRIRNVYSSIASGRAVYVNSDNNIGTLASTRRVKENIKPMDKASEAILAFKPVSFRYKKEIDASRTPQFGLIAEDVADINPDLVTRDAEGKPETVRYDSINAMLLNEFIKEHRTVQEQKATIAQLKQGFAEQQKQIEALTAGLQKVSAQVEVSHSTPQTVLNNQ